MVSITNDELGRISERIVDLVQPRRVILFGSQARGTAGAGSDIDLLIVGERPTDEPWSRRQEISRIRRALPHVGRPIDILLFTPEEVEKWQDTTNHVISEALREGRVLYERH